MTEPRFQFSRTRSFHDELSHFVRAIESREGHEVTLLFAEETTRMIASLLEYLGKGVALAIRKMLLFSGSRLISVRAHAISAPALLGWTARRVQALSELFEEWVMLNRLWGLLDVWMLAKKLWVDTSTKQNGIKSTSLIDTVIEASKLLSLASFHICEAGALLASKGVLSMSAKTREKLGILSVRCWAAFTFLELGRLLLEKFEMVGDATKRSPDWFKQWKRDFFANLAWAPVTVHIGAKNGILPQPLIDVLGVYATGSLARDRWIETAHQKENGGSVKVEKD